jgi:hypothetical protein
MKKFTKILEGLNDRRFFKIEANIELIVEADNEGEAGYISDSILGGIEEQFTYTIINIDETEDRVVESSGMELYPGKQGAQPNDNKTPEENIELMWESEFGDRVPTATEKMEWYHQMRNMGYDGIMIFNTLKNKF